MKKTILTISVFLFFAVSVFAQAAVDVNVRSGRQSTPSGEIIRIVFESEDSFIKKTNVSTAEKQITVEFPSAFNIISQKAIGLETSIKDRTLIISLKEPFEMKILRLSSPSRLVIDIAPRVAPEAKPQQEIVLQQKVYVLDPGHGGYDFGITGGDLKEKDIALTIARDIEGILVKKEKKVFLTRRSDQSISIRDRAIFANQKFPEIFISIHVSSSENFAVYLSDISETGSELSAAELYSLSSRQKRFAKKSRALAENIARAVKEEFNLDVILRVMSLPVLNFVGTPAVLIEVPSFKLMSYDQKTRARLAEAIIRGLSYYGQ